MSAADATDRRIHWLDGVRGAAALFVVLHHMWLAAWPFYPEIRSPWWLGFLLFGHLAVAVFIVVSGYSLALAPLRHGGKLVGGTGRFIRRRAWRILPAYWAALVFSMVVFLTVLRPTVGAAEAAKGFAVHAALLQDVFGSVTPNGTFWSIAVEWQIYFVFPLILLVALRTRMITAIALTTVVVVGAHGLATTDTVLAKINHLSPQFLALFGFGVLAAWATQQSMSAWGRRAVATVAVAAFGGFVALASVNGTPWVTEHWFWADLLFGTGVASALLLTATSKRTWRALTLGSRPAVFIGSFSYSLYLVHAPLLESVQKLALEPLDISPMANFGVLVVLVLPVILAFAYGFFRLFERPFLQRRDLAALRTLPLWEILSRQRVAPGGAHAPDRVRTNDELTEVTGEGLRWVTYTRLAIEFLMVASMVVLARLIPPAAFGMFAVVVIVQELATTLPSEGVGNALVQRREIDRRHLQTGVAMSLLFAAALAVVTVVAVFLVVIPVFGPATADLILLILPCCLLGALSVVPLAVLRRQLSFSRVAIIELVATAVRLGVTLVLAVMGFDATALVLGLLAGSMTTVIVGWWCVAIPLPRWHTSAARDLANYGGPASLAAIAWAGFRNGDYALVNAQLGAAQAGFYWRSYQVSVEYQKKIGIIMAQMSFPVLARAQGNLDMLALRHRMARGLTVVLFPMLALVAILAPVLIPLLFGSGWEPAILPAQILAAGGAATVVIDAVAPGLMAQGRSRAILGYGVAHFVVYVGGVLLVASRGLAAVAIVAAVVHGAFVVVAYQVLLRSPLQALRALLADLAPAVTATAGLAAAAVPLDRALTGMEAPALLHLFAVVGVGGAAYLLMLRICSRGAWSDLLATFRRIIPARVVRRLAAAAQMVGAKPLPGDAAP